MIQIPVEYYSSVSGILKDNTFSFNEKFKWFKLAFHFIAMFIFQVNALMD